MLCYAERFGLSMAQLEEPGELERFQYWLVVEDYRREWRKKRARS